MKYWVGVTDGQWFAHFSRFPADEVNFWQPNGAVNYTALQLGAPFLFKVKRPHNHIAGLGYFIRSAAFPASMVWETFGVKNGAVDYRTFLAAIHRLSQSKRDPDPTVGCTVLANPVFWPEALWIPAPEGWSGNIVRGRYYATNAEDGASLWRQVQQRLEMGDGILAEQPRHGAAQLVTPRLGQGGFRVLVTEAYRRRCALTGESTLPVLDAAHILPFSEHGPHEVSNGLLLRTDFHKLFDRGLVTVTPDLRVEVSSRIREEWFNGKAYYRLHGQVLANLPADPRSRPSPTFLQWHNEHRFRA